MGMRRLMRSERFQRARRAEEVFEETVTLVGDDPRTFMALISDRMWRRLAPPAQRRTHSPRSINVCAVGSELFVAGGAIAATGELADDVLGYDAVDDVWFRIPMTSRRSNMFAVNCGGRLVVGGGTNKVGERSDTFETFDADSETWTALPDIPVFGDFAYNHIIGVVAGNRIRCVLQTCFRCCQNICSANIRSGLLFCKEVLS